MDKNSRRIEKKSSNTAAYTCASRASSYYEPSIHYKSEDYIAPRILPRFMQLFVKFHWVRKLFATKLAPAGIYEYVIARTKYIDKIFSSAIDGDFDQILLMGAGFDSRAIRLRDKNEKIKIYELDIETTLKAKLKQFKKRHIDIGSTIFVKIDFNTENITDKLKQHEFQFGKKTLYILEGITMYLNEDAVENDFKFIQESAGDGSEVIFDFLYKSVLRKENLYYGEASIYNRVQAEGEAWHFGIEKGELQNFLKKYDLILIEQLNSKKLEEIYFTDNQGKIVGKVNGTHCIVYARK